MANDTNITDLRLVGLEELRRNWAWFLALGVLLLILGFLAVGAAALMTVISMIFFGWVLIVGGALEAIHAFLRKGWGGFFVDLLAGLLYLVIGILLVLHPTASAITLTLFVALAFIAGGLFRLLIALSFRFPNWGWLTVHGAISLLLGILIVAQWPISGHWVLGLIIGIDLIFHGTWLVMLALAARNLPEPVSSP